MEEYKERSLIDKEKIEPLVSIIVITYNSSKYVLETLESAKAQTYQNIELIVSDDCSTDNTVEICKKWIEENKDRFVRTELITVNKNTGITPNFNRGLKVAEGECVKFIAGDDLLLDNCITDCMAYVLCNKNCKILFGRIYYLKGNIITPKPLERIALSNFKEQKKLVYKGSSLPAPASYFNKNALIELGGFDENYLFIEDLPLWLKLVNNNIELSFIDKFVVKYRIHDNNICMKNGINYINTKFYNDDEKIILNKLIPYFIKNFIFGKLLIYLNYIIISRIIILLGNKNNAYSKTINLLIISSTFNRVLNSIKKTNV